MVKISFHRGNFFMTSAVIFLYWKIIIIYYGALRDGYIVENSEPPKII